MLRFAADEDLNNKIVQALLRRNPNLDILPITSVGLAGADDRIILDWAANQGRVLLTHDLNTMPRFAYERVKAGKPMPGVVEVSRWASIGAIVEDVLLLAECSKQNEWEGQVLYLPLR